MDSPYRCTVLYTMTRTTSQSRRASSSRVSCDVPGKAGLSRGVNPTSQANARRYQRHRPELTLLHRIIEDHYAAFVEQMARESRPLLGSTYGVSLMSSCAAVGWSTV